MDDKVNEVLTFWFGDAPFARSSDQADPQPTINSSITKQYNTLWFPASNTLVQTTADKIVAERFGSLLKDAECGKLDDWIQQPLALCALIVVLDQFSRHVYRSTPRPPRNDARAVELSEIMLKKKWHMYLPVPLEIFSLMPLRHSPTVSRLERVLSEIERRAFELKSANDLLAKFRRATQGKLESLRDASLAEMKKKKNKKRERRRRRWCWWSR
jgi:uncharacterized protein (DUF924 family)